MWSCPSVRTYQITHLSIMRASLDGIESDSMPSSVKHCHDSHEIIDLVSTNSDLRKFINCLSIIINRITVIVYEKKEYR
jgi:hypothetical protein